MPRSQQSAPAHMMKTFQVVNPLPSHFRVATCEEVGCKAFLNGFDVLILDETDPIWIMRMEYFRNKLPERCDRRYRERRDEHGTLIFHFDAGQQCFKHEQHRAPLDRPPLYIARGGDHRGNPTGEVRVHTRGDLFAEDLSESLGKSSDDKIQLGGE